MCWISANTDDTAAAEPSCGGCRRLFRCTPSHCAVWCSWSITGSTPTAASREVREHAAYNVVTYMYVDSCFYLQRVIFGSLNCNVDILFLFTFSFTGRNQTLSVLITYCGFHLTLSLNLRLSSHLVPLCLSSSGAYSMSTHRLCNRGKGVHRLPLPLPRRAAGGGAAGGAVRQSPAEQQAQRSAR